MAKKQAKQGKAKRGMSGETRARWAAKRAAEVANGSDRRASDFQAMQADKAYFGEVGELLVQAFNEFIGTNLDAGMTPAECAAGIVALSGYKAKKSA
jgi:hypothetical protein